MILQALSKCIKRSNAACCATAFSAFLSKKYSTGKIVRYFILKIKTVTNLNSDKNF
jgi:hypothetical protein